MADPVTRLSAALADRYAIERELGAGGMATVYLAHDVRHDRKVALKVLRPELSAILGAERFLHEIKTTANLQHPHILSLFDSGNADGLVFYVMPYVEGESLRDRLQREKQLPVDDAIRIAREVADALDYAHQHGVVHRDIKPENILLHGGHAQVADFGIALAVSTVGGGTRMTETGMSLGTPHYMAPEQAMGDREITPRADIYALGCVTYEMLTGDPPFTGSTAQAIVARVVTDTPRSLTAQRHTIAPHVEAAVLQALEKLPADRFATAAEFGAALSDTGAPGHRGTVSRTRATALPPYRRTALPWTIAAIAVLAAGAVLLRPAKQPPTYRYGLKLPASQAPIPPLPVSISRDGSRLLYVGPEEHDRTQLWVKLADRYEATPIPGTEGVVTAVFSPDGEWIAYLQNNELKKVRITGGAAVTLATGTTSNALLSWLDDGTIVFGARGQLALRQVADVGGTPRTVWSDSAPQFYAFTSPLPGGRGVLVSRFTGSSGFTLGAVDVRDSSWHEIQRDAMRGFYTRTGHVVYVRPDGALFAVPFNLGKLETRGAPVPLLDSIAVPGVPLVDLSDEGTLVVRRGNLVGPSQESRLAWVDRSGRETPVDTGFTFRMVQYGNNAGWALSPDGTRLAFGQNTDAGDNIWVKQLPDGPAVRVTFDSAAEYRPRWMPDGRSVLFASNRQTGRGLYRRPADGTGADELLLTGNIFEGQLSRDGKWLLARAGGTVSQAGGRNIGAMRVGVDTALTPIVATSFDESEIALSPDGQWLAYVSDETGRPEVFIRPFPATESAKFQVSTTGGVAPLWARSGRELFFVNATRDMMAVSVAPGAALRLGERRVLFRIDDDLYLREREFYTPYDVSPDGRRFMMARRVRPRTDAAVIEAPLIITRNWFDELRRLMAGR